MPAPTRRSIRCSTKSKKQGIAHLEKDGFGKKTIDVKRSLDMRYVGQVHECTVDIGTFEINAKTIEKVKDAFHKRHEELYTYSERHNAVEVVNISFAPSMAASTSRRHRAGQGCDGGESAEDPPQSDFRGLWQSYAHADL